MQHSDAFESAYVLEMLVSELTTVIAMEQARVSSNHHVHLLEKFVHDQSDSLCLFVLEKLGPSHLTVMVYHCENVIILRVIFLQGIRNRDQIALEPVKRVLLIEDDGRHLLKSKFHLELLKFADLASVNEVLKVISAKGEPISLIKFIEANLPVVMENAMDLMKYLLVPNPWRYLLPQVSTLPPQMPELELGIPFRDF